MRNNIEWFDAKGETERDLREDLEICEQASAGLWKIEPNWDGEGWMVDIGNGGTIVCEYLPDARFIAEAREGWPYAIRRALEAERAAEFWQGAIDLERQRRYKLVDSYSKQFLDVLRLRRALFAIYALVLDMEADDVADIIVDALVGFDLMDRHQEDADRGEKLYRELFGESLQQR